MSVCDCGFWHSSSRTVYEAALCQDSVRGGSPGRLVQPVGSCPATKFPSLVLVRLSHPGTDILGPLCQHEGWGAAWCEVAPSSLHLVAFAYEAAPGQNFACGGSLGRLGQLLGSLLRPVLPRGIMAGPQPVYVVLGCVDHHPAGGQPHKDKQPPCLR